MTIDVTEIKRRLSVLLRDQNMVNEYIRQYGPTVDMRNIKAIKAQKQKQMRQTEFGDGEDPVFKLHVCCPVCNENEIYAHELRAKSQVVTYTAFQVPVYAAAPGFKTVDYNILAVTVCPRCLFASADKKDFIRYDSTGKNEIKSQMARQVIMGLQEKIGERKAILRYITDYNSFFSRPRSDEAAIAAYRLAIARAATEAFFEQPYAYFKMGAYTLKIARILKDGGQDTAEALRESLHFMEESYRISNSPSEEIEMQTLYTIVALLIRIGEMKKANSYLGVFSTLEAQRKTEIQSNPALTTQTIIKWADKAKSLWEYRDDEELFKDD